MRLALLALRLPWRDVVKAAPILLRAADRLLRADTVALQRRDSSPTVGSLAERVERLEKASLAQADLVRDVAEQLSELTLALRAVAFRAMVAIVLAAAALGIAIVALVRTL